DVLLGTALAAEVANALDGSAVVIGPEVAPAAVPPLVVEGGFITPARVVEPTVMYGPAGADLLLGTTGVDVVVTGYLEERDDRLSLFVTVAHEDRLHTGELTTDPARPERLVLLAAALVGHVLDGLYPDGAPHYARPESLPTLTGGFTGPYGDYVRAVALAGSGLRDDALEALRAAVGQAGVPERAAELLADLEAVIAADEAPPADAAADPRRATAAALLGAALTAELEGDRDTQVQALEALTRAAPFLTYPLEALSYIYFDRDDGRSAARVLAVAVELDPESDLYWTNLGWAYYLVGQLGPSEEASLRALELDGTQVVAAYNLGLVRTVTGRLAEAMPAYERAVRFDPEVNDEAIADLENALELFPDEPGVEFAL